MGEDNEQTDAWEWYGSKDSSSRGKNWGAVYVCMFGFWSVLGCVAEAATRGLKIGYEIYLRLC